MAKAEMTGSSRQVRPSGHWWLFASLALLAILAMLSLLVLVPAAVRALPGRYAARLPGFLQDLRHRPHPDTLPTPVVPLAAATAQPANPHLGGVTFTTDTPAGQEPATLVPIVAEEQPTATAQDTATPLPTATATPTATPLPTATATPAPPVHASLPPVTHTRQTWNNCGPATVSMALQYYDQHKTQAEAAAFLKPDPEDKNVSPHEMAAYVRSLGLEAQVRVGGDLERLKRLLAAGMPVIVETWFIPHPGDQMGHYRLLTGYDDSLQQFTAHDSYNGPNITLDYDAFDELWRAFNRVYVVIYASDQSDEVAALLGTDVDDEAMYLRALETAQAETVAPGSECVAYEDCADAATFAWFNVGSSLNSLGRHEEAAAAYDQARLLGLPWRVLWYQFGPYEAYYAAGRYDDVITLATSTLNVVANLEESHYWRGMAYLAKGDQARARADFEAAVHYNPNYSVAREALESIP